MATAKKTDLSLSDLSSRGAKRRGGLPTSMHPSDVRHVAFLHAMTAGSSIYTTNSFSFDDTVAKTLAQSPRSG